MPPYRRKMAFAPKVDHQSGVSETAENSLTRKQQKFSAELRYDMNPIRFNMQCHNMSVSQPRRTLYNMMTKQAVQLKQTTNKMCRITERRIKDLLAES